ncbi:MAG TPA: HD domain-containing protein [Candidatus Micrarchaeota archaeon]|nr:HD domain-containing protein [Candidatus Micrarchaeota archaeon]
MKSLLKTKPSGNLGQKDRFAAAASVIFEAGMLSRVDRSGWNTIGIENPQNVSEHSFRVAVAGLILSRLEGLSKEQERQVLLGCILHDLSETRIGDFNKINKKYATAFHGKAYDDMLTPLGMGVLDDFLACSGDASVAGVINDADMIEMAACALEYAKLGNPHAGKWVESAKKRIKTRSGEKLIRELCAADPFKWAFDASGK